MAEPTDDEKLAQEAFSAGFGNTEPPPDPAASATVEVVKEPSTTEPPAVDPTAPAPKTIQVTQEQWDALQTAAGKQTEVMDKRIKEIFSGSLGALEERLIKKLLKEKPAAEPTATVTPAATDEKPDWKKSLQDASVAYQIEALEEDHPKWREIVGVPDGEGKIDPNNPFRKWLATQPNEYQAKINAANSAGVISRAIDKFTEASKTPAPVTPPVTPKAAAFTARKVGAIQPKGDGGQPAPAKTEHDAFAEGFRAG